MDTEVVLDANVVSLILSLLVPLGVGLVTKYGASVRLKQVVTLILTAVATLVGDAVVDNGTALLSVQMFVDWGINTAVAVFSYLGLMGIVSPDINAKLAPGSGLGSATSSTGNLPGDVQAP